MDVERAIEFLIQQHAKTEALMQEAAEERKALMKIASFGMRQLQKFDKRIEQGEKRLARLEAQSAKYDQLHRESDARFERMMSILLGRQNGHRRKGNGSKDA